MQKDKSVQPKPVNKQSNNSKPNEQFGFHFSSALKITDPNTGKVILQKRCE